MNDSRADRIQARLKEIQIASVEVSELAAEILDELPRIDPLGFYFRSLARQPLDWAADTNHFIARWGELNENTRGK